jgi:hypothetical protein
MFKELPLHDATLHTICIDWRTGVCMLALETGSGPRDLIFEGFVSIAIPRAHPWGPSVSIMGVSERDGGYEIEMQSGDVLRIGAASWRLLDNAEMSNPTFQRTATPPLN